MKGFKSYSLAAIGLSVLVGSLVLAGANHSVARAAVRQEFLAYGIASITPGQTARFHAVSVGTADNELIGLLIYDSQGNLLAHSEERLVPGRAATLELPFRFERESNRLEIYAVMQFLNGPPRSGYVIPTFEVDDDATGKPIFMYIDPTG